MSRAGARRQNARRSFDRGVRLLVRLLEELAVLIVVFVVAAVDDCRVLVVDARGCDFLHRPLGRILLVKDLFASESNGFLVAARVRFVGRRFVPRRRYLLSRPVHAGPFVHPLLPQRLLILPENESTSTLLRLPNPPGRKQSARTCRFGCD